MVIDKDVQYKVDSIKRALRALKEEGDVGEVKGGFEKLTKYVVNYKRS